MLYSSYTAAIFQQLIIKKGPFAVKFNAVESSWSSLMLSLMLVLETFILESTDTEDFYCEFKINVSLLSTSKGWNVIIVHENAAV